MEILCMIYDNGNVIHLSKLIECTPGVNPNVNYGLWVTMMYQSRSISCSKGRDVVGYGAAMECKGTGYMRNLCNYTPPPPPAEKEKKSMKY